MAAGKESLTIEVQSRQTGKSQSRAARSKELVPGVLYGPKVKNMNFVTSEKILRKYISHHFDNTIFTLKSSEAGFNNVQVLMKHKEVHPVTRRPVHVDFYALDLTKMIRVKVELRFTGKARGIADGGLFQPIARDVEVECLPNKIPEFFELDVSDLGVHESLHVSNIQVPEGVKVVSDAGVTLCTVTIIKEEELTPAPAATTLAEPEVIGKGKKEEGAEGAAPAADAKAAAPKKE